MLVEDTPRLSESRILSRIRTLYDKIADRVDSTNQNCRIGPSNLHCKVSVYVSDTVLLLVLKVNRRPSCASRPHTKVLSTMDYESDQNSI